MDEHMQRVPDPRDAQNVDLDAINNAFHYALYAVFRLADPLPADADASGDAALPGIRVVDTQVGTLPKAGAAGVYPYLAVAACLLGTAAGCGWMRRRVVVMAR